MTDVDPEILQQVLGGSAEPILLVRVDHTDWPVELLNSAFEAIDDRDTLGQPFADVIERLVGRDVALEISESLRSREQTGFAVEIGGREYLLSLTPVSVATESDVRYYAVYFRSSAASSPQASDEMQHALLKAKRKIRDLSRDDPATGLLNARAFREVFEHDWAVAAREKSSLALVVFTLDDFEAYVQVFGRHASDSCLRRVGQAIRRCLRRASDVCARIDRENFVVLSHASDDEGIREFADRISTAVRELGLHHPRSSEGRFVTVSFRVRSTSADGGKATSNEFLDKLLVSTAE